MMSRLMVDTCCGPCAIPVTHLFGEPDYRVHYLFYNANIHPFREYRRRLEGFEALMRDEGAEYTVLPYEPEEWMRAVSYREENRCEICYRLRLRRSADLAAEEGYDVLTTTLYASPYQDHSLITLLGDSIARSRGLQFITWDGSEGYRDTLHEARERGLYTQPYCGCLLSERERYDRSLRGGKKG
ncbi:MAG: epoxyqueuosine reductase QueH [Actinomycetota bacterium]|nr:epoxyqueuosine reductase QueH [Actinomycetota bacterium]